ncbi:MAG: formate dehydrogenase accessory sulfurtransferase FdhD [Chromatiales bacterium]
MTRSGLAPTYAVTATDEFGEAQESAIAGEFPLTVYVDKRELVTLMTLGTFPEALTLGYLRNQALVSDLEEILAVQVDWDVQSVAVTTRSGIEGWEEKLARRTVTTGCGQGTIFGQIMEDLDQLQLPQTPIRQSTIYGLLRNLNEYNEVYKSAGAVHGCALCKDAEILIFIEDVGRHNAVDAIAGMMWLDGIGGEDKLFYTTGRLTSEMVIKVAQMRIPALLSRSGITKMGLELAQKVGVTMIARAKGRHFLVYNGETNILHDDKPSLRPARTLREA